MKIHSVSFKNLNSLKGSWCIDFDAPDFVESGLFAITGPTGAGKTTILDAICLALYHETPRLKKATNKKNEIMTRHEKECSAEVVFSVKNQRYSAFWAHSRAKAGAANPFGTVKVDLTKIIDDELGTGESLATKSTDKSALIEELTGLNFSRFTRSALLAQGSFAAFLKADQNEKSEMLEQMTGSEVYGLISMKVFEKAKEEKERLANLEMQLSAYEILDAEAEEKLVEERDELLAKFNDLDKKSRLLQQQIVVRQDIEKLEKEQTASGRDLAQAQMLKRQNKINEERLEAYLPAMALQAPASELSSLNGRIKETNSEIVKHRQREEEILKQEKQKRQVCEELELKLKTCEETNREREKFIRDRVMPLDVEVERLQKEFERSSDKVQTAKDLHKEKEKSGGEYLHQLENRKKSLRKSLVYLEENKALGKLVEAHVLVSDLLQRRPLLQKRISTSLSCESHLKEASEKAKLAGEALEKSLATNGKNWQEKVSEFKNAQAKLSASKNPLLTDEQFAELIGRNTIVDQLPQNRQNLVNVKNHLDECHKKLFQLKSRREKQDKNFTLVSTSFKQAEKDFEQARRLYEKDRMILDLSQHRERLKEGDECPLCGSLEHPAIEAYAEKEIQRSQVDLQNAEKALQVARTNVSQAEKEIVMSDGQRETLENAMASDVRLYEQYAQVWNDLCKRLEQSLEAFDEDACVLFCRDFKREFKLVSEERERQSQVREALQKLEALCRDLEQKQQKCQFENDQNKSAQKQILLDLEKQVNESAEALKSKKELDAKLGQLLEAGGQKLPKDGQEKEFSQYIDKLCEDFTSVLRNSEKLNSEIGTAQQQAGQLQEGIKNALENVVLAEKEFAKLEASLKAKKTNRREIFADKNPQKEIELMQATRDKLAADYKSLQVTVRELEGQSVSCQTALAKLLEEKDKLLSDRDAKRKVFDKALLEAGFADVEAYGKALLSEDEYTKLKALKENCDEQVTQAKTRMDSILTRLKESRAGRVGEETLEQLSERAMADKKELEELIEARSYKQSRLDTNKELRIRFAKTHKEIEVQKALWNRWARLAELIGSKDGKTFRRYAQSITLDYLTILANRHLRNLHGRYELRGANDLGLNVVDTYQADIVRPVETLSGGESFLVSLSLALGLSDLASSKVSIESLFLDEGFGTLDPETLDVVLDALDKLHANGKMIGVISHVESLKERIPLQVQVFAGKGLGLSQLDERFRQRDKAVSV